MIGEWLDSLAGEDGVIDFLQSAYVERACRAIGLPEPMAEALLSGASLIREDTALAAIARQFHRELFVVKEDPGEANKRLLASGPRSGMLAAVVYLGGLPQMIDVYRAKGISERVWVDTMSDLAIWMQRYYSQHGEWGLEQVGWLVHHLNGELFRLGRLQFAFARYNRPFKAFRSRTTGALIALGEPGVRYRADGQADGTNGISDPAGGWTSSYAFNGTAYIGNPVAAGGFAVPSAVRLPAREWELVLEQGDTVMDVHIPEGGKMTHELCRDSYRQAVGFAARYFPEQPLKGFVCTSWLLSPQFPRLLPPEANIVRFQSDYYVIPVKSDERQTLERVFGFGTTLADLPLLPRETSLQRIVHDYLSSGGWIHGASGFLLKEDVDRGTVIAPEAGG